MALRGFADCLVKHVMPTTGELTPTMKLKRKAIDEKYENAIQAMHQDDYASNQTPPSSS